MKEKEYIVDGKIVRVDRIGIDWEPTHGFSVAQCDLCDEEKYPMVSWCCEHDDNAHGTSVCFDCLREIVGLEKNRE